MTKTLSRIFHKRQAPVPPPPERRVRDRGTNITAQFATALKALESTAARTSDVTNLATILVNESEKLKTKLCSECPYDVCPHTECQHVKKRGQ